MTASAIEKKKRTGRRIYVLEAALEYFIALLVQGSFLATVTTELGFSDSLTGILSSVISLGCVFELVSLTIRRRRVKGLVIGLSIANQLLFMLLYVLPLCGMERPAGIVSFCILISLAYVVYNLAHPKKISWLMSQIDDHQRGSFTAGKEIFSLITGTLFTYGMGAVIDLCREAGRLRAAFAIAAGVIFLLMVLHTLTLILSKEKETDGRPPISFRQSVRDLARNRKIRQVSLAFVLFNASYSVSAPFYGTYQIGELGMSLTYVAVTVMFGSIARILISKFWGRYGDRHSFAALFAWCMGFVALSQVFVIFSVPANGKILFLFYQIFNGIAMGGISSAELNLVFDYVPEESRADSLAVTQTAFGVAGFLATLCVSPLVTAIQQNGNQVFGIPLYAQQALTILAFLISVAAVLYTRFVIMRPEKHPPSEP